MDANWKVLEESIIYAQRADSDLASTQRRNEAITYINKLRNDPGSWKLAFQTFLNTGEVGIAMLFHNYRVR